MKKMIIAMLMVTVGIAFAGMAFAATSAPLTVTATIGSGTSSLSLDVTTLTFGTVTPTETTHRFKTTGQATVTYFFANSGVINISSSYAPATLPTGKVYGDYAGMLGVDGTYMAAKVSDPNIGGWTGSPLAPPNPNDNDAWIGIGGDTNKAQYVRIPDIREALQRSLVTSAQVAPSGSFPFVLGIDAAGFKAQAYTYALTVDLLNT